jgi:hypothetical protein
MKILRIVWTVVVIGTLALIALNLQVSMPSVQSAMQASQLYDEAAVNILGLIAITVLLCMFGSAPGAKPSDVLEDHISGLAEQTGRMADSLDRLEELFSRVAPPHSTDLGGR